MLTAGYLLGLAALAMQGMLVPRLSILAFAPFLALANLKSEFHKAIWLSTLAGCTVDLFSDDPMGLHALNYALVTALLYRGRKHFSYEQPLHLSLFTGLVSGLSTLLQWALLFLFDRRVPFGGKWIFTDLVGMPMIDAFYAFVWFAAPLALFEKMRRMWVVYWLKRKNLSPISH